MKQIIVEYQNLKQTNKQGRIVGFCKLGAKVN